MPRRRDGLAMTPSWLRAALWCGLLVGLATPPLATSAPPPGRWALDVGFMGVGVHGDAAPNLDLVLGGRGDQLLSAETSSTEVRLLIKGRLRLDLLPTPSPHAARLSRLGVRVERGRVAVLLGRHRVTDGGWRLVDGVQVAAKVARGVEVGGWFGLLPDPWTTAPSADRLGGGPRFSLRLARVRLAVVGEVGVALAGPAGPTAPGPPRLDRLAVILRASGRPHKNLRLAGRVDLQARPGARPSLADAAVTAAWRFLPGWDLRGGWTVYSSLAHMATAERDAALGGFARRREAAL
ncbi:MAG: hypothetical protein KDA24_26060, partial [Deltaproteobacteria bacterium]|nr:hypothetical protein [Deltaproteobacteria bacterium]